MEDAGSPHSLRVKHTAQVRTLAVVQLGHPKRRGGTWPFADDFSLRAARVAAEERAEAWLEAIDQAAEGADLVAATEDICGLAVYARLLESPGVLRDLADPIPGRISRAIGRIARRRKAHIAAGYYERDGKRVFNSAILMGPRGRVAGIHRKVQLAPGEEWAVASGGGIDVLATAVGRVGLAIGDDLLYPEIGSVLGRLGADVVAWLTRDDPGELIARTRALDHGYTLLVGHSARSRIIDRRGTILADGAGRESVTLHTPVDLALADATPPPPAEPTSLLGFADRRERLARRRRPELLDVLVRPSPPELDRYRSHRLPRKPPELRDLYRRMVGLLRQKAEEA